MTLSLRKKLKYMSKNMVFGLKYAINPQLIYGKESFFEDTREAKLHSVQTASHLIMEHFQPKTVVDIGCGEGLFINELHQRGVQVLGCDISDAALKLSSKDFIIFQADATKPVRFNRKFDLCICIEIAEHIPNKASATLVQSVTQASDTVFFTAAPPWQGGVGHINEQPREFWVDLFKAQGFTLDKALTQTLQQEMETAKVVYWLSRNLMIFRKTQ